VLTLAASATRASTQQRLVSHTAAGPSTPLGAAGVTANILLSVTQRCTCLVQQRHILIMLRL
jgi:hypothetical protein